MGVAAKAGLIGLAGASGAVGALAARCRADRRDAACAAGAIAAGAAADPPGFDPAMTDGLPAPARRYLRFAIAPGTRLHRIMRLTMHGRFNTGGRDHPRWRRLEAEEVLAPPGAFVWCARIGRCMTVTGSDGFHDGLAWTRFWFAGVVPLARRAGKANMVRAAAARAAIEAIWAPATLLPDAGAQWEAADDYHARVSFAGIDLPPIDITIAGDGRPLAVVTQRWTDANPQRRFRWQAFGASLAGIARFDGFAIPTQVLVANHFGTPDAAPFLRAEIAAARVAPAPPAAPDATSHMTGASR